MSSEALKHHRKAAEHFEYAAKHHTEAGAHYGAAKLHTRHRGQK